jgi:hypothetical protein
MFAMQQFAFLNNGGSSPARFIAVGTQGNGPNNGPTNAGFPSGWAQGDLLLYLVSTTSLASTGQAPSFRTCKTKKEKKMQSSISETMIDAGKAALHSCDFRFMDHDSAVVQIYEAMRKAKKQSHASTPQDRRRLPGPAT